MKGEIQLVEDVLMKIPRKELVRLILQHVKPSDLDAIPVTIFCTELSPLESITRYLREKGKRPKEIAEILGKEFSSVSNAYKNSMKKNFVVKNTDLYIPLSEFKKNLSIMESVVKYLKDQGMRFSDIGRLLDRNAKTIWTIYKRAEKKRGVNE